MKSIRPTLFAALAAIAVPSISHAELIYGIQNNSGATQQLVTFDSAGRSVLTSVSLGIGSAINSISSIDFRPATGQLYGYAQGTKQIYTINVTTGALTAVGPAGQGPQTGGPIDFNPTADAIRLVGTANGAGGNENFRVNPTTGALTTDTSLAYAAGDVNAGKTPNITSLAYINNAPGAGFTRLYDIDRDTDSLVAQDPANSGQLTTIGAVGFDVGAGTFGSFTGFDVSGRTGVAYVSNSDVPSPFGGATQTTSTLYSINLGTGAAAPLGTISGLTFGRSLSDITVGPAVVPEPTTLGLLAGTALTFLRRRRTTI